MTIRRAVGALGLLVLAATSPFVGCGGCPDLAVRAFEFVVNGDDPGEILITVTNEGTGTIPCADTALAEECSAPKGVYTITFEKGGAQFEELTGICTLGDATGCAAEDVEAKGEPPLVTVTRDATGIHATLDRQGVCP